MAKKQKDSATAQNNPDGNFEYEAVKFMFLNHFKNKTSSTLSTSTGTYENLGGFLEPYTRQLIQKYIDEIGNAQQNDQNGGTLVNKLHLQLLDRYSVKEENGKKILILKKKSKDDVHRRVLCVEESYDILVEAHKSTKHGGCDSMSMKIDPSVFISLDCIKYFLKLCNVCAKSRSRLTLNPRIKTSKHFNPLIKTTNHFNHTVNVDIVHMNKPDDEFKYVLQYQDKFTKFILLRPIVNEDDTELSVELLKIFADFGIPSVIKTSQKHKDLVKNALIILKETLPTNDIALKIEKGFVKELVILKLIEWMNKNQRDNWAIACPIVQMNLNTTAMGIQSSPYHLVFGEMRTTPANRSASPESTISKNTRVFIENPIQMKMLGPESNLKPGNNNVLKQQTIICSKPRQVKHYIIKQPGLTKDNGLLTELVETSTPDETLLEQNSLANSTQQNTSVLMVPSKKPMYECHECKNPINNVAYSCSKCNRPVHIFCCEPYSEANLEKLSIICKTCRQIEIKLAKDIKKSAGNINVGIGINPLHVTISRTVPPPLRKRKIQGESKDKIPYPI